MKAEELRINNLVFDGGEPEGIHIIRNIGCLDGHKFYKPIPLTEEWLIKLGGEYRTDTGYDGWYFKTKHYESIRIYSIEQGWFKYHSATSTLKYVHQLQNLFFSLTGEEMQIKTSQKTKREIR